MPEIIPFPIDVLTPKHQGFWPSGGVRSGLPSMSGLQQFDRLDGGPIWYARLIDIPVYCSTRVLAAQAIQSLAMAGAAIFSVPKIVSVRSPGFFPDDGGVPHSDGSPFSDGSLYAGGVFQGALSASAELFASVVTIRLPSELVLQGGEEFSINHPDVFDRLYRIMRVLSSDAGTHVVEISPPLRGDVDADSVLEFHRPRCAMRMTNPDAFLQALEWNRWADVTAEFEEAFW